MSDKLSYAIWYLFLMGWMQGMSFLNVAWVLLLIATIPYYSVALARLKEHLAVCWAILAYEAVRVFTTLIAIHPAEAAVGLFDDFRAISIGVAALVFIRNREQMVRSAWFSFAGFTVLSWWALVWQLLHYGMASNGLIIYGVFGHLNYAAVYSAIVMMIMILVLVNVPVKNSWPMLIGILPIVLMQGPLDSRATVAAMALAFTLYFLWKPSAKLFFVLLMVVVGVEGAHYVSKNNTDVFSWVVDSAIAASAVDSVASEQKTLPDRKSACEDVPNAPYFHDVSMQIRVEIWRLLLEILRDHPLGIGPRNHGFIDLNPYRSWIECNMVVTHSQMPLTDLVASQVTYDPHSQYMDTLVDGGVLGLITLLALWFSVVFAWWKSVPSGGWANDAIAAMVLMFAVCGITVALFHQTGMIMFFLLYFGLIGSSCKTGCEGGQMKLAL